MVEEDIMVHGLIGLVVIINGIRDGQLIMSAEAISVRFNLLTRKASEIQPEMLKRLESKKLNLKL